MKRFIHRHQPPANLRSIVLAGIGAAAAVGLLALVTDHTTLLLLMAPFGASAVLLFAAPAQHLSQPANWLAVMCWRPPSALHAFPIFRRALLPAPVP